MRLARHFADELKAAGLSGKPIIWREDGEITCGDGMTDEERSMVFQLAAAHDPSKTPPTRQGLLAQLDTATSLSDMKRVVKQLFEM